MEDILGDFDRIEKEFLIAQALKSTGIEEIRSGEVATDVNNVTALEEYNRKVSKKTDEDVEKSEESTTGLYVIPITFPDGKSANLVVDNEGKTIACEYKDKDGNITKFELSPEIQTKIQKSMTGISTNMDPRAILSAVTPSTLEELEKSVEEESLIPENNVALAEKIKKQYPDIDFDVEPQVKENRNGEIEESTIEELEDIAIAKKNIPPEAREIISRVCSENGYKISDLKEIMLVNAVVLKSEMQNTGLDENGAPVCLLRFRSGAESSLKDRTVMCQLGSEPIDERQYDEYISDYMTEHMGETPNTEKDTEDDYVVYTDLDGNTSAQKIYKEPSDLTYSDKELLQDELKKLDDATSQIISADMPRELKAEELAKINNKRLDLFKKYGIEVPVVEDEIRADDEKLHDEVEEPEEEIDLDENDGGREHEFPEGPWNRPGMFFNN
mgnify:CR=1 FL=1